MHPHALIHTPGRAGPPAHTLLPSFMPFGVYTRQRRCPSITTRQRRCPSPSPPQQGWCFVGLGGALTSAYAPGCPPPNASNYITDHPVPLAYTLGPSPIPFICGLRTRFSRNTVKSSGPARALLFKWVEAEIWRYGCRSTAATRALGCPQRSIFNSCATDLRRAAVIWRG